MNLMSVPPVRRAAWSAALTVIAAVGGCASNPKSEGALSGPNDQGAALKGPADGAPKVEVSAAGQGGAETSSAAERAREIDPTIFDDGILSRVHPQNISVNVVQHVKNAQEVRQSEEIARAAITPAIEKYAALGQYLKDLSGQVPANQSTSISRMGDLALAISSRVSVLGASAGEIEIARKLKDTATSELADWFTRTGEPRGGAEVLTRNGLLAIQKFASVPGQPISDTSAVLKESWTKTALLLVTLGQYGSELWGDKVADSRFEAIRLIATVLEHDMSLAASGSSLDPQVVQANIRVAAAAERFMQVVVVAKDPTIKQLRGLSAAAGQQVIGTGVTDAEAFAKFCALEGGTPDKDMVMRFIVVRGTAGALPGFFKGANAAPSVNASQELTNLLVGTLQDRGLVEP